MPNSNPSVFYSVFAMKCPRCHTGNLYETPTFSFKKSFTMYEICPHCKQKYVLEPGFYYGSMFISYLVTAFIMFSTFAIAKFGINLDITTAFITCTLIIAALFIWIFRISRSIWIHLFVKYDKRYAA